MAQANHTLTRTISLFHPPHRTTELSVIPIPLWVPPRRTLKGPPSWLTHQPTSLPSTPTTTQSANSEENQTAVTGWPSFSNGTKAGILIGAIGISVCLIFGVYMLWCQQWGWWMKSEQVRLREATEEEEQITMEATRLTVLGEGGWWGRVLKYAIYAKWRKRGKERDTEKKPKKTVRWDLGRKTLRKRKRKSITGAFLAKKKPREEREDSRQQTRGEGESESRVSSHDAESPLPPSSSEPRLFAAIFNRQAQRMGKRSGEDGNPARVQRRTSASTSEVEPRLRRGVSQRRHWSEPHGTDENQRGDPEMFDGPRREHDWQRKRQRPFRAPKQCTNRRRVMPFFSPEASPSPSSAATATAETFDPAPSTSASQHPRTMSSAMDSLGEAWARAGQWQGIAPSLWSSRSFPTPASTSTAEGPAK